MSKEIKEIKERLSDLEERLGKELRRGRDRTSNFDLLLDYLGLEIHWKPEHTAIMKKRKRVPRRKD